MDAHKKVKGRKRHLIVDTCGNLLTVVVHSAGVQDFHAARQVFTKLAQATWPRLETIFADAVYQNDPDLAEWVSEQFGWRLEIVPRAPNAKGFTPLPKRWVIERTFAWLGRNRRLSKDYELHPKTSETWIHCAMTCLMSRRLARLL